LVTLVNLVGECMEFGYMMAHDEVGNTRGLKFHGTNTLTNMRNARNVSATQTDAQRLYVYVSTPYMIT